MAIDKSYPIAKVRPDEASASAYLRTGRVSLHGHCLTNIGGLACEPYTSLDAGVSDIELGSALLRVLSDSRATPIPYDFKAEQKKVLSNAGVRSWSKLAEGVSCSVSQKSDEISILPCRSEGRGFMHLPELTIRISGGSTPEQVGEALREGFQRCTHESAA
jgi:hypothetical protein